MRSNGLAIGLGLAIFTATLLATSTTVAQEMVLHNFNNNGTDGTYPSGCSGHRRRGQSQGTTSNGGTSNFGTVFELTPAAGGSWIEKVLHSFSSGADGANPQAGLIFDAAGNLYGTTYVGGAYGYPSEAGQESATMGRSLR